MSRTFYYVVDLRRYRDLRDWDRTLLSKADSLEAFGKKRRGLGVPDELQFTIIMTDLE